MGAAIALAFAMLLYSVMPASATEDISQKVANTGTVRGVSEGSGIADTKTLENLLPASVEENADPVSLSKTSKADLGALGVESNKTQSQFEISFGGDDAKSDEIYEIVLGLRKKNDLLSNTIIGAERNFKYYVPINELATLFKFPSRYDKQNQRIEGYFLHTKNTYAIDLQNNTLSVKGETAALPEGSAFYYKNFDDKEDLYVSLDIANRLWSLDLSLDLPSLSLLVNTPKKLPYEIERARRKAQEKLDNKDTSLPPDLDLTKTPSGYRWLGPHVFTLDNRLGYSQNGGLTNTSSVKGHGDLLGTSADYRLVFSSDERDRFDFKNAYLQLTRKGYGDNKTLPLGLKELKLGDLIVDTNPLITNTVQGRGVYFDTNPQKRYNSFGEITISGRAEPGWEVELYRLNQLIDYGYVDDDGLYSFENVALRIGDNKFKIILYGPQGQIEERLENYPIDARRIKPHETHVEASLVDFNKKLIDVSDTVEDQTRQGQAGFIKISHGINHNLSAYTTLQRLPTSAGEKSYASVGAEFNAFGGLGQTQVIRDIDNKGSAVDFSFRRKFADINTKFRTALYNDFESPLVGFGDKAQTLHSSIQAFKDFNLSFANLSLSSGLAYEARKDGNSETRANTSQSAQFAKTHLSHNIGSTFSNDRETTTQGSFTVKQGLGHNWSTTGALKYELSPETTLENLQYTLNYKSNKNRATRAQLNVLKNLNDDDYTRISLNGSHDFGSFLGGATLSWDEENGYSALLNASTTFGPKDEGGKYIPTTSYTAEKTRLKIHLYEDLDKDGRFSEGDVPAQGIRLHVNDRRTLPSDENGFIDITNVGPAGEVAVTLERSSMPNPFLLPKADGYSVILRPGTKPYIDFPLYPSGSIDGAVRYADGLPMTGMIVQLLDENGKFVQEVPTLYDGFYVFEFVRPGTYTVQVSPVHQVNVPPRTVKVTSDDPFAYGVDLILLEQAAEVSVTENVSVVRDGGIAQLNHAPVADGTLQPAPFSTDGPFDTAVKSVRIGGYPHKTRLVLDLSGPTTYKITSENDGHIINIDLPSTAWDATRDFKMHKHPMFDSFEVFSIDGGRGTRLQIKGSKPITVFYDSTLPKQGNLPERIYVDFTNE